MPPPPSPGSARTVHRILEDRAEASGRRVALAIRENGAWSEITYSELSLRVRSVSGLLVRNSIGGGDRVAILSQSRPEWAIAFLGAVRNGAIVVPLDPKLTVHELGPILADCTPRLLFASNRFVETALELARITPAVEKVVLLQEDPKHPDLLSISAWKHGPGTREREPSLEDCAVIAYTSGTTGRPKGVRISYGSLAFQADCFERAFDLSEDEVFLSMLPLNHLFELTCGLLSVLNAGGQVAYCESLFPDEIAEAMRERRATRMLTVPIFLRALRRGLEAKIGSADAPAAGLLDAFGGRLAAFHSGGAPLERGVAEFFERLGLRVFEGYGLTETSPVIATNLPGLSRMGSVGLPLPRTEVKIADGEILVRGPHVMLGYHEQDELTREVIDPDGWFHTGDLGRIDDDGYLYVTGRLKSLIVLPTGKKVQPEEVEAVLAASPFIKEVCVLGCDAGSGEEVQAVAVPSETLLARAGTDTEKLREAIEADFAERARVLAAFKRPARIHVFARELPRTTTGKVRRRDVLRMLEGPGNPR
ncbi:MAG: AMP-dependent synthetase/ligase [Planctomycetota bacterium]